MPDGVGRRRAEAGEPAGPASIAHQYAAVSELFAALASPVRAAIVHELTRQERTVAELVTALGVSQPLVSQHLGRLRSAGLVHGERSGRQIVYRIVDEHVAHVFLDALHHSDEPVEPIETIDPVLPVEPV